MPPIISLDLPRTKNLMGILSILRLPPPQAGTAHDRDGIAHVIVKTSSAPHKPVHSSPKRLPDFPQSVILLLKLISISPKGHNGVLTHSSS